jgi:hypothetical protein
MKKDFDYLRQEKMWKEMPIDKQIDIDPVPKWARVLIGLVVLSTSTAWIILIIYSIFNKPL